MNNAYLLDIDNSLRNILYSVKSSYPEKLYQAIEYSLFPAGKRIRPYLSYLVADFVGVDKEVVKPFALSIEIIHNYSLIHDDLPCMDNDLIRRGRPSCHAKFGEAMALLAGDAMLNLAYEVLLRGVNENGDLADSAMIVADCAGGRGMVGGQAIEFSFDILDEDTVTDLCMKKTGALIAAAVNSVSLLSGDRKKISALGTYASALGLCFQLTDDILDIDKHEDKSYLGVMGMDKTIEMRDRLVSLIEKSLAPFGDEGSDLINFAQKIAKRDK